VSRGDSDRPKTHDAAGARLARYTERTVMENIRRWRNDDPVELEGGCWIRFVGTGGNPRSVVGGTLSSGGFVVRLPRFVMLVDPGPGSAHRAASDGIDLRGLDAVYVSHDHTDHAAGAGGAIEAMTRLMSRRRGTVLAPPSVFDEHVVSRYHQGLADVDGYTGGPRRLVRLRSSVAVELERADGSDAGARIVPVEAHHGQGNFGFVLEWDGLALGYTSDTAYITHVVNGARTREVDWRPLDPDARPAAWHKDLSDAFRGVDVLIVNVSYFNMWANRHVTALGAAHLLEGSDVRLCILTHFDPYCAAPIDIRAEMASWVSGRSGVRTVAAREGVRFDL